MPKDKLVASMFSTNASNRNAPDPAAAGTQLIRTKLNLEKKNVLLNIPLEILDKILSFSEPFELVTVSRTCKGLRNIIFDRKREIVWKESLANCDFPSCPEGMSIPAFVHLFCCEECTHCGAHAYETPVWGTNARFCQACWDKHFVKSADLPKYIHPSASPRLGFETQKLPDCWGRGRINTYKPAFDDWKSRIEAALGDDDALRLLSKELAAEEAARATYAEDVRQWQMSIDDDEVETKDQIAFWSLEFVTDQLRSQGIPVDEDTGSYWSRYTESHPKSAKAKNEAREQFNELFSSRLVRLDARPNFTDQDRDYPLLITENNWHIWEKSVLKLYNDIIGESKDLQLAELASDIREISMERLQNAANAINTIHATYCASPDSPRFVIPLPDLLALQPVYSTIFSIFKKSGDKASLKVEAEQKKIMDALEKKVRPRLAEFTEQWREAKKESLSALLGSSITTTTSGTSPSDLAVALYRCTETSSYCDSWILDTDQALMHYHAIHSPPPPFEREKTLRLGSNISDDDDDDDEEGEFHLRNRDVLLSKNSADANLRLLLGVLEAEPWNSGVMAKNPERRVVVFHPEASKVAWKLVEDCGLDPKTATTEELDAINPVVRCQAKACTAGTKKRYSRWRNAVQHWLTDHHDETPAFHLAEGDEVAQAQAQEKPVEINAQELGRHECAHDSCESGLGKKKKTYNRDEAREHIKRAKGHSVTDYPFARWYDRPFHAWEPKEVWVEYDETKQLLIPKTKPTGTATKPRKPTTTKPRQAAPAPAPASKPARSSNKRKRPSSSEPAPPAPPPPPSTATRTKTRPKAKTTKKAVRTGSCRGEVDAQEQQETEKLTVTREESLPGTGLDGSYWTIGNGRKRRARF